MTKFLSIAIALLLIQCWPAEAADPNCMNDYYRTKPPGCVDAVLSQFRQMPRSKSDPNTLIGFLAQLFSASPGERQRILDNEPSDYLRAVELVALYHAGLLDDARAFSDRNQLSALRQKLETNRPAPIATIKPIANAADNDLLIGAYMASGDTALIQRILDNFSTADDGIVSDALRMGYMRSKFGNSLVPKERESVTAQAACAKYQCKTDLAKFLRVLTLSSAFWALQSMSQHDDGIKKTLAGFFDHDPRLKNLLAAEQNAFGNYLTALLALVALKSDHSSTEAGQAYGAMNKSALAFETLEPAGDAFAPFDTLTKSGKKPN